MSAEPIGVLVVDDSHVVRMGLAMLLDSLEDIIVLGEATEIFLSATAGHAGLLQGEGSRRDRAAPTDDPIVPPSDEESGPPAAECSILGDVFDPGGDLSLGDLKDRLEPSLVPST